MDRLGKRSIGEKYEPRHRLLHESRAYTMKLLMLFVDFFAYQTNTKSLTSETDYFAEERIEDAIVGLIHVEQRDAADVSGVETKLIKNLKWAARKNSTKNIVLHSFAHLSDSKAAPGFTKALLAQSQNRLVRSGYEVHQTPFGYFLDLQISVPGTSLARIFKSF